MPIFNPRRIAVALLVLIASLCFCQALPTSISRDATGGFTAPVMAEAGLTRPAVRSIETQPIETIRVGQRVFAHNPEVTDAERRSRGEEPNFTQWVYLKLEMPKEDGSILEIDLLRPQKWVDSQLSYVVTAGEESGVSRESATPTSSASTPIEDLPFSDASSSELNVDGFENDFSFTPLMTDFHSVSLSPLRPVFRDLVFAAVEAKEAGGQFLGLTVELDIPELGLTGEAIVTDIVGGQTIEPPDGLGDARRVVTATFHHSSGNVIDLVIGDDASDSQTIGTTSNHLFWSVDRQEYVQAGSLQTGEHVRTLHGDTKTIVSILPRPGPEAVFNFEVHAEHVYFVGEDGVLVHNSYLQRARKHWGDTVENLYKKGSRAISNILNRRHGRTLTIWAGDHRLPKSVIEKAWKAAGASRDQIRRIRGVMNGKENLRIMEAALNSSKNDLNMVQWARILMKPGNKFKRPSWEYLKSIHNTQKSIARQVNDILNEGAAKKVDFFEGFFKAR